MTHVTIDSSQALLHVIHLTVLQLIIPFTFVVNVAVVVLPPVAVSVEENRLRVPQAPAPKVPARANDGIYVQASSSW